MRQNNVKFGEKDVRQRLVEALRRYGYKQVDVSKETGIHHSSLSLWLQGKIRGHYVRIEETIEEWLQNLYANKPRFSRDYTSKFLQIKNKAKTKFQMEAKDVLIPVRIDLEMDGRKYKDTVLWNLNEPFLTPEVFAKMVSEENNLSAGFEDDIASAIRKAIENYIAPKKFSKECIKTLELDVRVENICLRDRFEWDINDSSNSPEDFAVLLCNEMGLNSEFATQIALQIREQILLYKRSQALSHDAGYGMGYRFKKSRGSIDPLTRMRENSRNDPVTPDNCIRPILQVNFDDTDNLKKWEPSVHVLTQEEIKKHEQLEERKYRHERRGNRYF